MTERYSKSLSNADFASHFWSRTRPGIAGCINWLGSKDELGYGHCRFRGRVTKTHRIAWIIANGEVPEGLCVLHHCDRPTCVNVRHLFIGTVGDNNRDKARKGRATTRVAHGQDNVSAALTNTMVRQCRVRVRSGETVASIARELGVKYTTLHGAVIGYHYKTAGVGVGSRRKPA